MEESWLIEPVIANLRLDHVLASLKLGCSRSQIQKWIKSSYVCLDGIVITKPKHIVLAHQKLILTVPEQQEQRWIGQPGLLNIVYEDEALLVLNKPDNLVMHPGAGQPQDTLLNYILDYYPDAKKLPRAGLVHRLDKNTTGLCVVAKQLSVQQKLSEALQARQITRRYFALVHGLIHFPNTIDAPIGRHPHKRTLMSINPTQGKPARTHYKPLATLDYHTLLDVELESGRTHQIRVHLNHQGYPILGDPQYGQQQRSYPKLSQDTQTLLSNQKRQCLHAYHLSLVHPVNQKKLDWECPLPEDFNTLLQTLKHNHNDILSSIYKS